MTLVGEDRTIRLVHEQSVPLSLEIEQMPAGPVSWPWRKLLRFSVRGLIVVVLITGLWFGWIVRSARIQREAVRAVERNGGFVRYYGRDYVNARGGHVIWYLHGDLPWRPHWLVPKSLADRLEIDVFDHVIGVSFTRDSRCTGTDLASVATFAALHDLHISDSHITDSALIHLEGMKNLTVLFLQGTQVTDEGLDHLKGLTGLRNLSLLGTRISDDGLARLEGLTNLQFLDLSDTQVTDAWLQRLEGLTTLWDLRLRRTRVSDAGLKHLKGLKSLGSLSTQDTAVTAAGRADLKKALPRLTWFD
jgi:hypothetical protein